MQIKRDGLARLAQCCVSIWEHSTGYGSKCNTMLDLMQGPLINIPIIPAPSNGQVTFRKGSNDHLAIDIDSESERLISKKDTEEKGLVSNDRCVGFLILFSFRGTTLSSIILQVIYLSH